MSLPCSVLVAQRLALSVEALEADLVAPVVRSRPQHPRGQEGHRLPQGEWVVCHNGGFWSSELSRSWAQRIWGFWDLAARSEKVERLLCNQSVRVKLRGYQPTWCFLVVVGFLPIGGARLLICHC